MAVRITFDDGPDPQFTPQVLDALDHARVKATFFVIGERLSRHPEIVSEIAAHGHVVAPHCWEHRSHVGMGLWEIARDLRRTLGAMREIGIPAPTHWRPPYGSVKRFATRPVADAHRLRIALWDVDPRDWHPEQTAARMLEDLRSDAAWRAGGDSVVLLHDGRCDTPRLTAENTVDVIGPLVMQIRRWGWETAVLHSPRKRLRRPRAAVRPQR